MVGLGRPYYYLKFFKGCLPQVLLGPFLDTSTQLFDILWSIFYETANNFKV